MSIQNASEIDEKLGNYAIVEGYMGLPLYNYLEYNLEAP